MALSPELKARWQQILQAALSGSAEETLRLRCGMCGGPLRIVFTGGRTRVTHHPLRSMLRRHCP